MEVQANAIDTVLRGFPLQSLAPVLGVLLILAAAVLPVALSLRASSLLVSLSAVLLAVVFGVAVELAFRRGLILPVPDLIVSLVLATGGVIVVEDLVERRKRRSLEVLLQVPAASRHGVLPLYRRDQSGFIARSLRFVLITRFGDGSVFLDETAIEPGQQWPREIEEAILGCSAMLVIMGPYWATARPAGSGQRRLDDPGDWVRARWKRASRAPK